MYRKFSTLSPISRLDKTRLPYEKLHQRYEIIKDRLGKPMTLAEKIVYRYAEQHSARERKQKQRAGRREKTRGWDRKSSGVGQS